MSDTSETILIEADTIEAALEVLSERYGSDATIVSAERARRGGFAGFFAREVVELVAIPPLSGRRAQEGAHDDIIEDTADVRPDGVDSAFARLLDAAEQADSTLARPGQRVALLEHPTADETSTSAAAGELRPRAAAPVGGVRWDVPQLIEIGLPGSLIEGLMALDPADDLAHVERLARSIEPLTGDLPAGPHRMIGTHSGGHSADPKIADRSIPVHLVLAEGDELDVTKPPPSIVSWTHEAAAPTAIAVAWQTGATLGWLQDWDGAIRRVTAVDAAIAIRQLLEAR
jgi:hypothetical protein